MAVAANKRSVMTLFSGPTDIFSHQVRIVLAEKGVSFEIEHVEAGNLPQDLIDLNPYQTVPTLVDRELTLYDSRIIMEYLDERFPHPPLMPVYPVMRAQSRVMMHRIEQDWYSLMNKIEKGSAQEANQARKQLTEELVWRLPVLGIDLSARPSSDTKHLQFYMQRVFERDSFLASLTEAEREMRLQSRG